jgi:hypothetical protein
MGKSVVIPACASSAQTRNPAAVYDLWIPGSRKGAPRNDGVEPYPIAVQTPSVLRQAVPRAISIWPLTVTECE